MTISVPVYTFFQVLDIAAGQSDADFVQFDLYGFFISGFGGGSDSHFLNLISRLDS
jgi:hypothetical protein